MAGQKPAGDVMETASISLTVYDLKDTRCFVVSNTERGELQTFKKIFAYFMDSGKKLLSDKILF